MKLDKGYQYFVLCEDAQMKSFILSFLGHQGISSRRVRVGKYPGGEGCGEAFVRREYPKEVQLLRRKSYNSNVLIVCTDADNRSVKDKEKGLDAELSALYSDWQRAKEPIIMWIPKREIETWLHFLRGEVVDESTEFRHSGKPASCRTEAGIFSEYCQDIQEMPQPNLPSIISAKNEYLRVCGLQKNQAE